jgi:hypothetical protein
MQHGEPLIVNSRGVCTGFNQRLGTFDAAAACGRMQRLAACPTVSGKRITQQRSKQKYPWRCAC